MADRYTISEVIRDAIESRVSGLYVAMPGKVTKYDASKQVADVEPQFKMPIDDGDGGRVVESLPTLQNVQVVFPRGGGCFLSFPIQVGDFVLLVFCDRDVGHWRERGQAVDPGDLRAHPLSGAVAWAGFFPNAQALDDADANDAVFGRDGSSATIHLKPSGEVHLGAATAANFVALANLVKARIDTLQAAHDAHQHPETGGTTGVPTSLIGPLADVAAQKVKAQ